MQRKKESVKIHFSEIFTQGGELVPDFELELSVYEPRMADFKRFSSFVSMVGLDQMAEKVRDQGGVFSAIDGLSEVLMSMLSEASQDEFFGVIAGLLDRPENYKKMASSVDLPDFETTITGRHYVGSEEFRELIKHTITLSQALDIMNKAKAVLSDDFLHNLRALFGMTESSPGVKEKVKKAVVKKVARKTAES